MNNINKVAATALCAALITITISGAIAAVPSSITYQGKLTDSTGVPVPDGSRSMTFRLYNAQSGGTLIWNSGAMNVVTTGGVFSAALGASPTPPVASSSLASGNVWLEVQVGVDTPLPRVMFHSAPYALRAEVAESVADNSITSVKIADGTIQLADIGQNGASANQVIKRNSTNTAWTVAADNDTTYSAGTGLSLAGTTFSLNSGYVAENYWAQGGNSGTNPASEFVGTSDNTALELKVNSSRALRIEPTTSTPNLVGGYVSNEAVAGVLGAFVGGGGNPADTGARKFNRVTDHFGAVGGGVGNTAGNNDATLDNAKHATVAGGQYNEASASLATVGGGWYNRASYERATVGGGWNNLASNHASTVGGGRDNIASGSVATVPGGASNRAQGNYSLAAGQRAKADHQGSFVWADSTAADFVSTADNQFLIRASGGVGVGTASPGATLHVSGGSGKAIYGKASNALAQVGYGVYGEASFADGVGVYGTNVTNSSYGHLGASGTGAYGRNLNGHYGYLGGTDRGAHGQNSNGNSGYLGGADRGAYGANSNGNAGSLGGSTYGVMSEGDLIVTGAYKGILGPNGGAPFPRPAYDSGWITVAAGTSTTLTHGVGGNSNNYVVDIQMKNISYYGTTNVGIGGYSSFSNSTNTNSWYGAYWCNLSSSTIKVWNHTDSSADNIRIRIWLYN